MKNPGVRILGLVSLFLSVSGWSQIEPPPLPEDCYFFPPGFYDIYGVPPLAYTTNLLDESSDGGYGLILDTTNRTPAYLNYKVSGNISYANGTILFFYCPNWSSISQGGTGPGEKAYFIGGGD